MDSASEINNVRNRNNSLNMGNMDEVEMNYRINNNNQQYP